MTTEAAKILDTLGAADVIVTREGDRVRLDGPKGVMAPAMVERVREHKRELLAMLKTPDLESDLRDVWEERMAICLIDGRATYGEAEQMAWEQVDRIAMERRRAR